MADDDGGRCRAERPADRAGAPHGLKAVPDKRLCTGRSLPSPVRLYAVEIVSTLLLKFAANCVSERGAGPLTTMPDVLYCDPWQGHSYT
jgi:hypothetical protein